MTHTLSLPSALFALIFLLAAPAAAQLTEQPAAPRYGRAQPFFIDALTFGQTDQFGVASRLDLYVQVPFDQITFITSDNVYRGSYTLTALINDENGNRIREESWTRTVERTSFESTVSPILYDISQRSIALEPGTVLLEVIFEDKESSREMRVSRSVEIRKFDKNLFGMSDLMLVSAVQSVGGKKNITPQIDPNVAGLTNGFFLFLEMYNPFELPGITIAYTISRRNQVVMRKRETQQIHPGQNSFIANIQSDAFSLGTYTIDVDVYRGEDTSAAGLLVRGSKQFLVEWLSGGIPLSVLDLDNAIDQLRYFAKSGAIDYIKEGTTEEERRKRFEAFWEQLNPVPGSKTNRAMIEYYSRVAYANEHFRHFIEGWKTDRGMVYIIYGPPNYVDRHPSESDTPPYEIWEYYDINKRYTFVDETGFGDYRLRYPIWDDRNRLR